MGFGAVDQTSSSVQISPAKVMQGHGNLDQALQKVAQRPRRGDPNGFPYLVSLEIIAAIKRDDPVLPRPPLPLVHSCDLSGWAAPQPETHLHLGLDGMAITSSPTAIVCAMPPAAKPLRARDHSEPRPRIPVLFTTLTAASATVTILLWVHGDVFSEQKKSRYECAMPSNSRTRNILSSLAAEYPDATCSLNFQSPLELLIATILSAQCTDERVNQVTKSLFQKYRSARDYASVPLSELESDIQSTGFYRNKAKSIRACCERLDREFGGKVPPDMDALVELPGVGRKTANVVLGTAFGIPSGIVVDTHVARISRRLGLTDQNDPVKIEQDLMTIIPQSEWIAFSHRMIQHGRRYCQAKKPNCRDCPLADPCPKIGVAGPAEAASSKRILQTPAVSGKATTATPRRTIRATGSRGKRKGKG